MQIAAVSLFPQLIEQVVQFGMPRRAVECGALSLSSVDLRDYAERRDRRIDARPYGGGPGMVMQAEPVLRAVEAAKRSVPSAKVVALSPQGEHLTQPWLQRLSKEPSLVLLCGRYEGWDERLEGAMDLELSLGDFVLSGGELAAMALIDGIARLLPGVLGDEGSAENDSFSAGLLDHPHYTRPREWRGRQVPEVLLSGDHAAIRCWRLQRALAATWLKRPELLTGLVLDEEQVDLLRSFIGQQRDDIRRGGS